MSSVNQFIITGTILEIVVIKDFYNLKIKSAYLDKPCTSYINIPRDTKDVFVSNIIGITGHIERELIADKVIILNGKRDSVKPVEQELKELKEFNLWSVEESKC